MTSVRAPRPAAGTAPAAVRPPQRTGRYLVTGASGFVGRALCRRLSGDGAAVRAVMRTPAVGPWAEQANVDLSTGRLTRGLLSGVDAVIHVAGKAHDLSELQQDDGEHQRVSVIATAALLEAAAAAGVPAFVYLSSAAASTSNSDATDPRATTAEPATAYGRAKLAAERLVLDAGAAYGLHVCNLRPVVIYGPDCRGNIPRMLAAIDGHRFPPVPEVGNRRSMVHVDDVVEAALLAAVHPRADGSTYHVTDGQAYSTRQMYEGMAAALGVRVPPVGVPRPVLAALARVGDGVGRVRGRRFVFDTPALQTLLGDAEFDSTRIETELGFQAHRTFADALPEMVAAYRRR